MLINLLVIISVCVCLSNHHSATLYVDYSFVNYTSIKPEKTAKSTDTQTSSLSSYFLTSHYFLGVAPVWRTCSPKAHDGHSFIAVIFPRGDW